jgi:ABC-type antimicrobial peptide transport system permease subunit
MVRHKAFSVIVILGLTIGISVFGLISLYVYHEFSYDRFNQNYSSVYRLEYTDWALTGTAYGPEIARQFPEIKGSARVSCWEGSDVTIRVGDKLMKLQDMVYADPGFFDIFSLRFVKGNPDHAIDKPNTVVLTESTARTIFGSQDPINKTFMVNNKVVLTVTGIIRDVSNFHLKVNAVATFVSLKEFYSNPDFLSRYDAWNYYTYFYLEDQSSPDLLASKINDFYTNRINWMDSRPEFHLRPLREIYFTHVKNDFPLTKANPSMLKLYMMIALFILFIACINFINLTIARSATRSREIGVRKVVGGSRARLVRQFLGESIIYAFIATELSLVVMELLKPGFNNLIQRQLGLQLISPAWLVVILLVLPVLVGLLAGIYPALYLTRFKPVITLKSEKTKGKNSVLFRRVLIIGQFTISIVLIIATFTVYKQLGYLKRADLGFSKENVINVYMNSSLQNHRNTFHEMLLQEPHIKGVSFATQSMVNVSWQVSVEVGVDHKQFTYLGVDDEFIPLMGIQVLEGRNFRKDTPSDSGKVIINEEAIGYFNLKRPTTGEMIGTGAQKTEVLGVVKNFHFNSLRNPIGPIVMMLQRDYLSTVNIKVDNGDIPAVIDHLKAVWDDLCPDFLFEYHFLDQNFEKLYNDEMRLGRLFLYLALLAIFIASMGLMGLSSLLAEQKTKEIGIRKAMGDSTLGIIRLFSLEFGKWVLLSGLIAMPLAYWIMTKWLISFAYHVSVDGYILAVSSLLALLIATVTVTAQTYHAASGNPVEALRYE